MTYNKKEVIELAAQVLGVTLDLKQPIPLPVLESLGLAREWSKYVEVAARGDYSNMSKDCKEWLLDHSATDLIAVASVASTFAPGTYPLQIELQRFAQSILSRAMVLVTGVTA